MTSTYDVLEEDEESTQQMHEVSNIVETEVKPNALGQHRKSGEATDMC